MTADFERSVGLALARMESMRIFPMMAGLTLSIGVVAYPGDGRTSDELMIAADAAMYRSKRSGKNRVTGVEAPAPAVAGGPNRGRV